MLTRIVDVFVGFSASGLLIGLLWCTEANAQQTSCANGKQYIQSETKCYQIQGGRRFEVIPSSVTVKPRLGISSKDLEKLHRSQGARVVRKNPLGFVDLSIAVPGDIFKVVENYLASGLVESAELNTLGEFLAIPDDPLYTNQWNLAQENSASIDMQEAWNIATGKPTVVIGILDSGTDWTHEDLGYGTGSNNYSNIWLNTGEDAWSDPNDPTTGDGADNDGDGLIDDWKGWDFHNNNNDSRGPSFHGTAVAGIVAAKANNGIGVAGIAGGWGAQGARLMIVQVGDDSPDGSVLDDAILYAASKGAMIIQMSLNVGQTPAIDAALAAAYLTYGCVIVCAAGNDPDGPVQYPATSPYVLGVTATDQWDNWASYSSKGPQAFVAAPGSRIYSTLPGSAYGPNSGTSLAAPHVSAIAALNKSTNPNLTNTQNIDIIRQTADDKGPVGKDEFFGWGRVNAYQSVMLALGSTNRTLSSQSTAFNGQRKLYKESVLHEVFTSGSISGGEVYYRCSTDDGATWAGIERLSDGTMKNGAPCIAMTGSANVVVVCWQKSNGSNYDIQFSSTASGNWNRGTIESKVSCADPGPLPVVAGNYNTNDVVIIYRSSTGLRYSYSRDYATTWSAPATIPGTKGDCNAPSAYVYTAYIPSADVCNLAFATDRGHSSELSYCSYSFSSNHWAALSNISSVLPGTYHNHRNPTLGTSSGRISTVHVAWEATIASSYAPVIVHRKGCSGNFGNQYSVIQYQSAFNPSITGLSSDDAWMVLQNSSDGGFSIMHYSCNGGSWQWSNPTVVSSSGTCPQLSVGSGRAKCLWTSGTSSPYTVSIGAEAPSDTDFAAADYSRELNIINTLTGSSVTVEIKQLRIVHKDGAFSPIAFVEAPSDSTLIGRQEILKYGGTKPFELSASTDTLKFQYAVRTIHSAIILQDTSAFLKFTLVDVNRGNADCSLDTRSIPVSSDTTSAFYEVTVGAGNILGQLVSNEVAIHLSISAVNEEGPELIASLGHIYRFGGVGEVKSPTGGVATDVRPKGYLLQQNYPNPFNPSTTIQYCLPHRSHVTLAVFNTLGQQVAELVNGNIDAGYHSVHFDGGNLASGVYFYRLQVRTWDSAKGRDSESGAGNFTEVKKLCLIR